MEAQVLARKWRPRSFGEMIGQEHITRTLMNALKLGRMHQAYLFCGTRGVGKTTVARILAKSFFCERRQDSEPCNDCISCDSIDKGNYPDLIEVDAASRTKVEDTRELLGDVQFAPLQGKYKIYLIDEVHMLSNHSFNALLKSLEEPPPHIIFLFATTEPFKLPMTMVSRCLKFNLKAITEPVIASRLEEILTAEGMDYDKESAGLLARYARGSMRDALSLTDQAIAYCEKNLSAPKIAAMLGMGDILSMEEILDNLIAADAEGLLAGMRRMEELGADFEEFLNSLMSALQDIAVLQMTKRESEIKTSSLGSYVDKLSAEEIQLFYQIALLAKKDLAWAPSVRRAVDMAFLRMLGMRPVLSSVLPASRQGVRPVTANERNSMQTRTAKERDTHAALSQAEDKAAEKEDVARAAETVQGEREDKERGEEDEREMKPTARGEETTKGSEGSLLREETTKGSDGLPLKEETTKGAEGSLLKEETTKGADESLLKEETTKGADESLLKEETTKGVEGSLLKEETTKGADGSLLKEETTKGADGSLLKEETTKGAGESLLKEETTKGSDGLPLKEDATKGAEGSLLKEETTKGAEEPLLEEETTKGAGESLLKEETTKKAEESPLKEETTKGAEESLLEEETTKKAEESLLKEDATKGAEESLLKEETTKGAEEMTGEGSSALNGEERGADERAKTTSENEGTLGKQEEDKTLEEESKVRTAAERNEESVPPSEKNADGKEATYHDTDDWTQPHNWARLVRRLRLDGLEGSLLNDTRLVRADKNLWLLRAPSSVCVALDEDVRKSLEDAVFRELKEQVRLDVEPGAVEETPAMLLDEKRQRLIKETQANILVQDIVRNYDGELDEESVTLKE